MSNSVQFCELPAQQTHYLISTVEPQWYALHTRFQHEKSVSVHLQSRGITTYLPLTSEVHRWSDRRKIVEVPLFSCYTFVLMPLVPELCAVVMRIEGVLQLVGARGQGVPIPERQIDSIRTLLAKKAEYMLCPFLKAGQHVRIRGGALDGIEGTLMARNGQRTLLIAIEPIQRSLAVRIGDYQVQPL